MPRVSTEHKLYNGLVRNHHHVLHFSDRDIAAFLAPFKLRDLGRGKANDKLVEVAGNFQPDMLLLGHCDIITNETLKKIRNLISGIRIAYRNVDPLFVPHNVEAIKRRIHDVDAIFVTTAGKGLEQFKVARAAIHYIPNPTDLAVESLDNSVSNDLPFDVFFCGNSKEHTERTELIVDLRKRLESSSVVFKAFGYFGEPNVWGHDYDRVLARSKMGINLNRQEGDYLYSSARLAQLMGNGILALVHSENRMEDILGGDTAAYFASVDELAEKIRYFAENDDRRRQLAKKGLLHYREHFSSEMVAQYIVERTIDIPLSKDYIWAEL